MTCKHCLAAAIRRTHGIDDNCNGCVARMVARGPAFKHASTRGFHALAYRDELKTLGLTHEQVIAAQKADKMGQVS